MLLVFVEGLLVAYNCLIFSGTTPVFICSCMRVFDVLVHWHQSLEQMTPNCCSWLSPLSTKPSFVSLNLNYQISYLYSYSYVYLCYIPIHIYFHIHMYIHTHIYIHIQYSYSICKIIKVVLIIFIFILPYCTIVSICTYIYNLYTPSFSSYTDVSGWNPLLFLAPGMRWLIQSEVSAGPRPFRTGSWSWLVKVGQMSSLRTPIKTRQEPRKESLV